MIYPDRLDDIVALPVHFRNIRGITASDLLNNSHRATRGVCSSHGFTRGISSYCS